MSHVARLNAGLLARKGSASPAFMPQKSGQTSPVSDARLYGDAHRPPAHQGPDHLHTRAKGVAPKAPRPDQPHKPHAPQKSGNTDGVTDQKRIALSLRLDKEKHLQLKILSAHLNQSGQMILENALDMILESYQDRLPDCACLKGMNPKQCCQQKRHE
ncbi:hypothetical protein JCM17846_00030 [Iodidimonas nitroreducens]|uniref:Uncharacterized protein n=1 Tax=Iodidimonas nitroreducens TaxID=1236968 RepID=A0A5A7N207_9PROT|nr:hypothetical protein [Iodidimonas nitroreducens]GAK34927.1 hypothetical protein AQ1_02836 [alpha proteobacterium Q-1]GER02321.1 hypothetical protein JCM17846_00030 [Iodidimonas nitroreducens]